MRTSSALSMADRLCRAQKVGLFGHRGVGKTTLLTMLYREAVAGRLPELRLAAGDAVTANYLADKVLQLESGAVLPATLAETELHFQLYHRGTRLELIVKDYQGENVAIGKRVEVAFLDVSPDMSLPLFKLSHELPPGPVWQFK